MKYDPECHHRCTIRLKEHDYSQAGAYFVTLVTQGRACLFDEVGNGETCLSDAGRMIQSVWYQIPAFYPGVDVDAFVVMPNHVHAIIVLVGAPPRGRPHQPTSGHRTGRLRTTAPMAQDPTYTRSLTLSAAG